MALTNLAKGAAGGAAAGAAAGAAGGPVGALVGAGIGAVANLFGAKKGANAAKDATRLQNDYNQKALDEQKRVYDLERADAERDRLEEQRRYELTRADAEASRGRSASEQARQSAARQDIFAQWGTNPYGSGGNSYGRNNAPMAGGGQPSQAPQSAGQGAGSVNKELPPNVPYTGGTTPQPVDPGAPSKPTVTLQAPTGEVLDVELDQAPDLIRKGAVIVPKGGRNAFGGPIAQMRRA